MSKSPAFQFYVQDFIVGTLSFSTEEIGAYILLLCHQWDKGYIAENEASNVARISTEKLKNVLGKFQKRNGRFINKRLEIVRKEKIKYSKMQASKGKQGAEKRWQRLSSGHSPATVLPMAKNSSSSSTSTSIKENITK